MYRYFFGLGSNIGDRAAYITEAINGLGAFLSGCRSAPLYETAPRDYEEQDDFLNTVVGGSSRLEPNEVLMRIQSLERKGGRDRSRSPEKGPRTIDIDILLAGDLILSTPELTIPHQSMHERLFVLEPLLLLEPDIKDPRDGQRWSAKASRLSEQRVKLYGK